MDGSLQSLPTATFSAAASPAVITGSTSWANVAFLIGSGPHALSWVYAQGSTTTTSAAYVDGLQVITPVPVTNSVNQVTNNATHPDVPVSNLDLAVTEVIAPTGTYLLDDANGTGRLPVTITVTNLGYDFDGTTLTPSWDPADLEIHLSTNRTFGDSDDIDLGSFAALDTLDFGDEAVFDGEINLPFDIPGGDYFLLVRYAGSAGQTEFTYANNTQILGPGYVIQRAPDLVINSFSGLASNNPYHPEDSVFVRYTIGNTSLGTVLTTQPFKVTIELMALGTSGTDLTTGTVIKSYNPATYSLFLPEVGGQYPNGGSSTVTHFLDLPSLRDTLAKLGFVTATTPEDDGTVSAKAFNLSSFNFYFRITVDSGNAIAESSETNTFYVGNLFSLTAVPASLNVGEYFGQSIFSTLTNSTGGTSIGASTAAVTFTGSSAYASLVKNYALGVGLAGAPQTLFQPTTQNGYPSLTVPPGGTGTYLTETFDFNIRANDVQIDVQASADPTFATGVTTLLSLTPPYGGTSGNHSLSGFGGLKDNPFVLAVDGNNTSVQETYVARVTVRDSAPTASFSSRFMRLNITPASGVSPPSAPPISAAGYSASSGGIVFFFSSAPASGAYVIERSVSASSTFNVIGTSTSTSFLDAASSDTYNYRLRTVNSAGASTTTTAGPFTVP